MCVCRNSLVVVCVGNSYHARARCFTIKMLYSLVLCALGVGDSVCAVVRVSVTVSQSGRCCVAPLHNREEAAAMALGARAVRACPRLFPSQPRPRREPPPESWRVLALFLQVRPPHVCTGEITGSASGHVRTWRREAFPICARRPRAPLLATFERGAERRSARLTWALLRMTTKPVQSAGTGVSARPLDVGAASRGRPDRGRLAWAGDRSLPTSHAGAVGGVAPLLCPQSDSDWLSALARAPKRSPIIESVTG